MASLAEPIEAGQFDDAPEQISTTNTSTGIVARPEGTYIDTYEFQDEDFNDDDDDEYFDEEDDDPYDDNRVEDEDWEVAERDFTKQYNRLRQHVAVRSGHAQGVASATAGASVATLPAINHPRAQTNQLVTKTTPAKDKTVDQLAALSSKYNSKLAKIDNPYALGVGVNRKGPSAHANQKDKSDRATNEQVLDPRTRLILFKMIGRGLVDEVNGCISTGKEANVYHALSPEKKHLALKIYKTSILVFKDRDKYVSGEYRFRRGYSRRNPRKMVRIWAEKEMRNLKRLVAAGIRSPDPIEVRENVLVMTFLGDEEGWASPRLKDASLPSDSLSALYIELVLIVRRLFHRCKLVHADLSEYNILYHQNHLFIIDVSQSVEHDHPSAFDFLRNDIKNVEDFFGRLGVQCLGLRRCFEFVTRERIIPEGEELPQEVGELEQLEEHILSQWLAEGSQDTSSATGEGGAVHEDSVFLRSFIPRTLNEVYDPERDVEKLTQGQGDELIYADTIGLVKPSAKEETETGSENQETTRSGSNARTGTKVRFEVTQEEQKSLPNTSAAQGKIEEDESENEDEENSDDSQDGEAEEDGADNETLQNEGWVEKKPRGHRHEDKEAKKERKKAAKDEAKERRKHKMPKAEKKKLVKRYKT